MSTTTQVNKVKINKMSKARYAQTTPVATELYMLTDVLDPQYDTLPTADAKYAGQITQYTGESVDGGYTNGYFYKCAAQGTSPETYAWEQTDVQPSGGSGLPDQTGHAGEFLTTDGTDASWSGEKLKVVNYSDGNTNIRIGRDLTISDTVKPTIAIGLKASVSSNTSIAIGNYVESNGGIVIGRGSYYYHLRAGSTDSIVIGSQEAKATAARAIAIGPFTEAAGYESVAIGCAAHAKQEKSIQIGQGTNNEAHTFCIGLSQTDNYKLLDSDGTIPAARLVNAIDDSSTTATGQTWSASKLNTMIGDVESLLANI